MMISVLEWMGCNNDIIKEKFKKSSNFILQNYAKSSSRLTIVSEYYYTNIIA